MIQTVRLSTSVRNSRTGFSLLEVMLATALLAASAMVLSSLLGLGAKFGSRAEQLTEAISQAQSLMDEFVALPPRDTALDEEMSGELAGTRPRGYRIRVTPVSLGGGANRSGSIASVDGAAGDENRAGLVRVTVEILATPVAASGEGTTPLCRISRLVRQRRLSGARSNSTGAAMTDSDSMSGALP